MNREVFFYNEEVLNSFCDELVGRSYNEETRMFNHIFAKHIKEAYEADKRLTAAVQERIDPDIIPIVEFYFCNTCDLNRFDFHAVSKKENVKILKAQELLFNELCDQYFSHINGLLIKINEAAKKMGLE